MKYNIRRKDKKSQVHEDKQEEHLSDLEGKTVGSVQLIQDPAHRPWSRLALRSGGRRGGSCRCRCIAGVVAEGANGGKTPGGAGGLGMEEPMMGIAMSMTSFTYLTMSST